MTDFKKLTTETRNPRSEHIDKMSALEIAQTINEEDKTVAYAVEKVLPEIAAGIEWLADSLYADGRVFYCGAGTSGRLGIVDASEIPPTYGLDNRFIGLMAGGPTAIINPQEDAEDNPDSISGYMRELQYGKNDILVAISASGSAECVKGAMRYAKECGTKVIAITCNASSGLIPLSDLAIVAEVGPEVVLGSTRMKSGTAQKLILNMLSTGACIRYGRVRGNYMAYMKASNHKLFARAIRMIQQKTGCDEETAKNAFEACNHIIADAMDMVEGKK